MLQQLLLSLSLLGPWLTQSNAQVVQWDIERRHYDKQTLRRRDKLPSAVFETPLENDSVQGGYFASLAIGKPGQDVTLLLDTGSSDVWVPASRSALCSHSKMQCPLGSFNPSESKTYRTAAKSMFHIEYEDDSYSRGDYFTDDIRIGRSVLSNFTMGLGLRTSVAHGIIGLGYASNEASLQTGGAPYANLPVALEQQKLINSVAYSLWLNDLDASSGSILFGGVDTAKFVGPLTRLKVQRDSRKKEYVQFAVSLTSVSASSDSGSDALFSQAFPANAVLDSGTTLTYLPPDVTQQIWEEVGAVYEPASDFAVIPCSFARNPGNFTFGFSGDQNAKISVGMDELVMEMNHGQSFIFAEGPYQGQELCGFGIQKQSDPPYLLGDTFMRSAYVVYDLVNNEVAVAQTVFNTTKSKVMAFPSHGAKIPASREASNGSRSSQTPDSTTNGLDAASGFQDGDDDESSASLAGRISTPVMICIVILAVLGSQSNIAR